MMKQLEVFEVQGKEDYVSRLKKSRYGLKQSPRQWYKRFNQFSLLPLMGTTKVFMIGLS